MAEVLSDARAADPVVTLTGFARALRAEGVAADGTRLAAALEALTHVDVLDFRQVYWAGRVTLCSEPEDLPRYDTVFKAWFRGYVATAVNPPRARPNAPVVLLRPIASSDGAGVLEDDDETTLNAAASDAEVLRDKDFTTLTDPEREELHALVAMLAPRVGTRRTRRRGPGGRDGFDARRTVRAMLRAGGEVRTPARLRRRTKPRRLVLLLDVSASMSPYSDVMLRFGHAAVRVAPASTEVFTIGTRLTRVTRQLRLRDPELALRAAGDAVPDWSGGTRLGESLQAFLDLWGQRGTARRAVVVIASDGWERGDAALLGEQMARLRRLAHRVVWVNPHRGREGFAPVTVGMTAALPHLDDLLAGHTLDTLRTVADVIADA